MSGFNNPIIGGGGGLVYPSIHSPNFQQGPPIVGWSINKDGSAFFSGTIGGTRFIVNATGMFFYNGVPGATTLAASIAPAGGTDPFGTAVQIGFVVYASSSGANGIFTRMDSLVGIVWSDPANMITAAEATIATVFSTNDALQLTSPQKLITDVMAILAIVRAASGGTALVQIANAALNLKTSVTPAAPANGTDLYVDAAGKLAMIPQAGTAMQVPGTQKATFPNTTVTQAALTTIASATYPANDAEVGSVYELEVWGDGTQGSTLETLEFSVLLGAVSLSNFTIGSTAWSVVSQGFDWRFAARVICHTTGVSGTWTSLLSGELSAAANLIPSNSANTTGGFMTTERGGATGTVDSTVNQTLALQCKWGATTGAPTLTSRVAMFKRIA